MNLPSGKVIELEKGPLIMGVINVTPDSFSDGGKFLETGRAVAHGIRLVEQGADILDIGGESSRPGSDPVPLEEELERVLPVVRELAAEVDVPLSVDTTKARVAAAVIEQGADMINDISAMRFDPDMARVAASTGAGLILMHMRGTPKDMQKGDIRYDDVVAEIRSFFEERCRAAMEAGVAGSSIMVDPGIGFGKKVSHNLEILKRLPELADLGFPVVIGTSRKSFIGKVLDGLPVEERLEGTLATVALAVFLGAGIVRVHDVKEAKRAAVMACAVRSPERYA